MCGLCFYQLAGAAPAAAEEEAQLLHLSPSFTASFSLYRTLLAKVVGKFCKLIGFFFNFGAACLIGHVQCFVYVLELFFLSVAKRGLKC